GAADRGGPVLQRDAVPAGDLGRVRSGRPRLARAAAPEPPHVRGARGVGGRRGAVARRAPPAPGRPRGLESDGARPCPGPGAREPVGVVEPYSASCHWRRMSHASLLPVTL